MKEEIKDLIADLLRRSRLSAEAANTYDAGSPGRERCEGKSFAYRHSADMLSELLDETDSEMSWQASY